MQNTKSEQAIKQLQQRRDLSDSRIIGDPAFDHNRAQLRDAQDRFKNATIPAEKETARYEAFGHAMANIKAFDPNFASAGGNGSRLLEESARADEPLLEAGPDKQS